MQWTHKAETPLYCESYTADRASVVKIQDGFWTARIWPKTLVDVVELGTFPNYRAARKACHDALPEHLR